MTRRNIYLSGPMSGYPDSNYPLFHRVTAELRGQGHRVYNPAEFPRHNGEFPIRQAFASYAVFICLEADQLVLLPGWETSKGVSAERALALNCGIEIVEWAEPTLFGHRMRATQDDLKKLYDGMDAGTASKASSDGY